MFHFLFHRWVHLEESFSIHYGKAEKNWNTPTDNKISQIWLENKGSHIHNELTTTTIIIAIIIRLDQFMIA